MKVLIDYVGHADLYYSAHLLFEKRLGWELFRPEDRGGSWLDTGLWTSTLPPDAVVNGSDIVMGIHEYSQHVVSFEEFRNIKFDFIVTTSWENEIALSRLTQLYQPQAKFIRHMNNIKEPPNLAKNILLSTLTPMPSGYRHIQYHPEHKDTYQPDFSVIPEKKIYSFFNNMPSYKDVILKWTQYQKLLSDYEFKMYGMNAIDGSIPQQDLHNKMREAMFIWHTKPHGGCGYVARQALFSGKPLIVDKTYCFNYDTLAQNYLVDGINCIDIKDKSNQQVLNELHEWAKPDRYTERCQAALAKTKQLINFEQEAVRIKEWLLAL
jgi:hypothetical protein